MRPLVAAGLAIVTVTTVTAAPNQRIKATLVWATGIGGTYTLKIRLKNATLAACNGSGVERAAVARSLF